MTAVPVTLDACMRRWSAARVLTAAFALSGVATAAVADLPAAATADSTAAAAADLPAAATADSTNAAVAVPAAPATPKASDSESAPAAINLWDTGVNATGAVLMTPLFPGWGQLYSDGGWRAALAFGTEMYFLSNLLTRDRQEQRDLDYAATLNADDPNRAFAEAVADEHHEQMKDFAWWAGGALLVIALDAYVGAHLFDFDQDPVPVPDRWEDVFGPVGVGPAATTGDGPVVTVFLWRKGF